MTRSLLALVLSLLSAGINADSWPPAGELSGGAAGLGYLSSQGPISVAAPIVIDGKLIAGSSYPEAYQWTGIGGAAMLGASGRPNSPARGISVDGKIVVRLANTDESPDEEFRWTRGGGIIGLGFVWRFR